MSAKEVGEAVKGVAEVGNLGLQAYGTYLDYKDRRRKQRKEDLAESKESKLTSMENAIRLADRQDDKSSTKKSEARNAGQYAMNYLDWKKKGVV